jgi:hypothetical protein
MSSAQAFIDIHQNMALPFSPERGMPGQALQSQGSSLLVYTHQQYF